MKSTNIWAKYLVALLLFLNFYSSSQAQDITAKKLTDDIAAKMILYGIKKSAPILFIHFDKNIYTPNENVWFTGYFFKLINKQAYQTLSVALIKDDDQTVLTNDKFIIRNNLCFGNTAIPDWASSGNYTFIAFTNRLLNGKPDVLFTQKITIRGEKSAAYYATLNPLDTSINNNQQKIMLMVTGTGSNKTLADAPVNFYVGDYAHPVIKGQVKTKQGQYIFDLPSNSLSPGNNRLHVDITQGAEIIYLNIDLPVKTKPAIVHFFPEGGNMVAGVSNVIGWEAKNVAGTGLRTNAILYEGQKMIDSIHTDNFGFGKFNLTPKANTNYSVRLIKINRTDTAYSLPVALTHLVSLSIPAAVVNNELYVDLKATEPQKINVMVHNYTELFSNTPVDVTPSVKRIKLLLDSIPKGLTKITLTDSLGRPLTERSFFAHFDKRPTLNISTDNNKYTIHQKVNLRIKLDNANLPDSALVSIACVQEDKLDAGKANDIESYFYLKNQLSELPAKSNYMGGEKMDKDFLENVLLIKDWSRYKWLDMLKTPQTDTISHWESLIFNGVVTAYGDSIKKPVSVININHILDIISTDGSGRFNLVDSTLITNFGKRIRFIVNNDKKLLYQIHINDPYYDLTKKIIANMNLDDLAIKPQLNNGLSQTAGKQRSIMLKEVKITDATLHITGANICGDYVCRYHIFNCRNHVNEPDNVPPIIGESYYGLNGPYKGCEGNNPNEFRFKGIYAAQEFYPSDLSQPNSPPEYMSTIYWKYLAKITSSNEVVFPFYTNDLLGNYKVIVQGRTTHDVVYGEKTFEVKGK